MSNVPETLVSDGSGQDRKSPYSVEELLDKRTPKRGLVIDTDTGLGLINFCDPNPLSPSLYTGFLKYVDQGNDQFVVMYKREVYPESSGRELMTPSGRIPKGATLQTASEIRQRVLSTRSVGITGHTLEDPSIRAVFRWSEYASDQDPHTWISFYNKWHWAQTVESGEIRLGNVQRDLNPLKWVPDIIHLFRPRKPYWAAPVRAKMDPNSPPIMGMRYDSENAVAILEKRDSTEVKKLGDISKF